MFILCLLCFDDEYVDDDEYDFDDEDFVNMFKLDIIC